MNKTIAWYLLTILSICTVFSVSYSIICSHSSSLWMENSDLIHGLVVINHLIYEHASLKDFVLGQTPYFFPDLFLTYIIGLWTSNILVNATVYVILQILYLLLITALLLRLITNKGIHLIMGVLFILFILSLSNELFHQSDMELLSSLYYSEIHFGSYLMIITGLYLFIILCKQKKNYQAALFYLLMTISICSDVIVGFYLTIPLMLTVLVCRLLKYLSSKHCFQLSALLAVTTLSGYLLCKYCPLYYLRDPHLFHYHAGNVQAFIAVMSNFFRQGPAIATLWLSFICLAPLSLLHTYRREGTLLNPNSPWINMVILFLLVMTVSTVPALILTDYNLSLAKIGYVGLRHLQPFILAPITVGLPLLLYANTNVCQLLTQRYILSIGFLLIFIASFNRHPLNTTKLFSHYPPAIACLDQQAKQLHLHAGIGDYWVSRPFTFYNHSHIKILNVNSNFSPEIWLNTSLQAYQGNQFDFIVSKSPTFTFNTQAILSRFGHPSTVFTCPGNYEFYVYKNGAMKNLFPEKIVIPKKFTW